MVELRDDLARRTGFAVTLAAAVARAVGAYSALLSEGRGLTAAEAAAAMERRHQARTVQVLGDVLAAVAPDAGFKGLAVDEASGVAVAHFGGRDPVVVGVGAASDEASWN